MDYPIGNNALGSLALARLAQAAATLPAFWRKMPAMAGCFLAMAVLAGCASTEVTSQETLVTGKLPRPNHIWVYDFAATPTDVPRSSDFADPSYRPPRPQTSEEIEAGRQSLSADANREQFLLEKRFHDPAVAGENASVVNADSAGEDGAELISRTNREIEVIQALQQGIPLAFAKEISAL